MRARLHDPIGPWWSRAVLPGIGVFSMALGTYWFETHGPPMNFGFFVGLAIVLLSPLLLGRNRPRIVELAFHAGRVTVKQGGILGQTIRSKNVLAASTARTDTGVSLALVCKNQKAPLLLELEGTDEAKAVCDALGIGHHGFGTLKWERDRQPVDRTVQGVRMLAAALWIIFGFSTQGQDAVSTLPLVIMAIPLTLFAFVAAWLDPRSPITLDVSERGVGIIGPGARRQLVPFADIHEATRTDRGITLSVTGHKGARGTILIPIQTQSHLQRGMTGAEVDHALAQIQSASARARGLGAPRTDVTDRLEVLRRGSEGTREWLVRIDALADRMKMAQPGYRDATVDKQDLLEALHDHDCLPELRVAAARMLVRVDAAACASEVDEVVEAVRDPVHARLIRIATDDDVEVVAREIDAHERRVDR
ncbi:MAG: hypothetical protein JWM74_6243 [Myxococcaceae bacterium]|nr:hypothetical protein [Myxococcaceae bacterium]